MPHDASDPVGRCAVRSRVHAVLTDFVATQQRQWADVPEPVGPALAVLAQFVLSGGKRLRPAFCYWGWRGAGGADTDEIVAIAASVELLHTCALIHDDVMDGSQLRRGRPAVHGEFARLHARAEWAGDAESFGRSAAILLGDLCLIWSDELYCSAGMSPAALGRARSRYDQMRVEPVLGQYLDLADQAQGSSSLARARVVARYKSAKYTVERPLQLGGSLAGGDEELLDGYSRFGLPLGEAFQLRDDVLGVFGDVSVTGKPVGDDLREGKRTALVLLSEENASAAQRAVLHRHFGDAHLDRNGIDAVRAVVVETGGLAAVEALIEQLTAQALDALALLPVDDETRAALSDLAAASSRRQC